VSVLTRSLKSFSSRALRTTWAPAFASDWAIDQPSPRDAPVMSAILLARSNIRQLLVHADSALDIKDWQFDLRSRNWLLFGKNYRCILKKRQKIKRIGHKQA
jgi:hypothetical protein